jgi:hypothetical protein
VVVAFGGVGGGVQRAGRGVEVQQSVALVKECCQQFRLAAVRAINLDKN